MKNFNKLFEEAAKVADHRTRVFNKLIEKTKTDILPKFCDACVGFNINRLYFKMWNSPLLRDHYLSFTDEEGDKCFGISIDTVNKKIEDCSVKQFGGPNGETHEFRPNDCYHVTFDEAVFLKSGIVPFIKALNNRLENYVNKYDKKNKEAEQI